jgi:hemerythrin superfamily protein
MKERNDEPIYPLDAIALLKADHQLVHDLFTRYASAGDVSTKQMLAEQVFTALEMHAQLEENVFYPAYETISLPDTFARHFEINI